MVIKIVMDKNPFFDDESYYYLLITRSLYASLFILQLRLFASNCAAKLLMLYLW